MTNRLRSKLTTLCVLSMLLAPATYAELIAYYGFDGNAEDSIGQNHGQEIGNTTYAPGIRGSAASFDGNADWIAVSPILGSQPTWSVAGWIYLNDTNYNNFGEQRHSIFGEYSGTTSGETDNYITHANDPNIQGLGFDTFPPAGGGVTTVDPLETNRWYAIAIIKDSQEIRIYVDGALSTSGSYEEYTGNPAVVGAFGARLQNATQVYVPNNPTKYSMSGLIDEVGFYDHALSETEVISLAVRPTLIVEEGRLLGANNVEILGDLYNVRFTFGSCASEFDGCDSNEDFFFRTEEEALAASQALLDQVFLDGPEGAFDSIPEIIGSCTSGPQNTRNCQGWTPFELDGALVKLGIAANASVESIDGAAVALDNQPGGRVFINQLNNEVSTWAIWESVEQTDPCAESDDVAEYASGAASLSGAFEYQGTTYNVSYPFDSVKYGDCGAAYVQPQEYKRTVSPAFSGPGYKINCSANLDAPRAAGVLEPGVQCTWKAGNGSSAPTGAFQLDTLMEESTGDVPTFFRGFTPDGKSLKGDVVLETVPVTITLNVPVDFVDYRNGNRHKARVRGPGRQLDTSALDAYGVTLDSCENNLLEPTGITLIVGVSPSLICNWSAENGESGTVQLK